MHNTEIPKPLEKIAGKPLIGYILETLQKIGIPKNQIWIVTHHCENQIQQTIDQEYQFIHQQKLNGTAGAVRDALIKIGSNFDQIAVFNADDSMFYRQRTITKFIADHLASKPSMTLLTIKKKLDSLGSVVRDQSDRPKEIWPESRCRLENLQTKEIVCGAYLFDRYWLVESIDKLQPIADGEIGLPYLIEIAYQENHPANVFQLKNPNEWMGVNTSEELAEANRRRLSNWTN